MDEKDFEIEIGKNQKVLCLWSCKEFKANYYQYKETSVVSTYMLDSVRLATSVVNKYSDNKRNNAVKLCDIKMSSV